MTIAYGRVIKTTPEQGGKELTQGAFTCDNCKRLSIAYADGAAGHASDPSTIDTYLSIRPDAQWTPRIGDVVDYADVPLHVASAASEAHACASIGANRAAILMARSVIEASAKENGINSGSLHLKIVELQKRGIVRPLFSEAALGIKDYGNDMAHGDFTQDVSEDDVADTLTLMAVVLQEVFQVDARTKALRAKVASRKNERDSAA
jgi:hypothetical protein